MKSNEGAKEETTRNRQELVYETSWKSNGDMEIFLSKGQTYYQSNDNEDIVIEELRLGVESVDVAK